MFGSYLNVETRRCITKKNCEEMKKFSFDDGEKKCLRRCPAGYKNSTFTCEKCIEPCPRSCIIEYPISKF